MINFIMEKITVCIFITSIAYSATVLKFDEGSTKEYLTRVTQQCGARDVAEVLGEFRPNLEEYIDSYPQSLIKHFRDKLNYFTERTSLTVEAYLAQQSEAVQISPSANIDGNWEEKFQAAAISQLLLPQEFKNAVNINKYLALLRGIDPKFEAWLHPKLYLYTVPLASDVMNTADNYRVYEAIREYYRSGGAPLSVLLAIKAAEEKKKKEAEEWHFSDALCWLPFGSRSSSAASTHSLNEGTPANQSFGSNSSSGSEKKGEHQPLLAVQGGVGSQELKHRKVSGKPASIN